MAWFWPGILKGSYRDVTCAHCGRTQRVARRPAPFEISCEGCKRRFTVREESSRDRRGS